MQEHRNPKGITTPSHRTKNRVCAAQCKFVHYSTKEYPAMPSPVLLKHIPVPLRIDQQEYQRGVRKDDWWHHAVQDLFLGGWSPCQIAKLSNRPLDSVLGVLWACDLYPPPLPEPLAEPSRNTDDLVRFKRRLKLLHHKHTGE